MSHPDPEDDYERFYEAYIDWLLEHNPDCPYIRTHGADDGSLIAWESGWNWDDFCEYMEAKNEH